MKFETISAFALHVIKLGGTLYRVGGSVRDEIMYGMSSGDNDYVIEGLEPQDMEPFQMVGKSFPVYLVEIDGEQCEVALCRTERKTAAGYNGFAVSTKDVTIQQDLERRDLTINAIAFNVVTGEYIDPFGGIDDIKGGVLRHVSDAFAEDPLRVVRVARFAATFKRFRVHEGTKILMRSLKHELATIPGERIAKELNKAYAKSFQKHGPIRRFFDVLDEVDALEVLFPEVKALQVPDKHDGTAYNHVMKLLKFATNYDQFLGLLAHDLGKGLTDPEQHPAHHGHEVLGMDAARALAKRLRLSNRQTRIMVGASESHMNLKRFHEMKPGKKLRMVLKYGDLMDLMINISMIDSQKREDIDYDQETLIIEYFMTEVFHDVKVIRNVINIIDGGLLKSFGVKPDKNFGQKLEQARITALKKLL